MAAHCAGWKSRNAPYYHQKEDPVFAALWTEAEEIACDALEHKARERAIGWDEPIINKDGEVVGQRRCYSDKMMEMLLKAKRRKDFGDKVDHEVTHGGGVIVIPQPMNSEEFEKTVFDQQQRHREARIVSEQ